MKILHCIGCVTFGCRSDDHMLHIWSVGMDVAAPKDCTLQGHQSDVKCVDWHPYRGLIASGSRDTSVRLWDAKQGMQVRCVVVLYHEHFLSFGVGMHFILDISKVYFPATKSKSMLVLGIKMEIGWLQGRKMGW